jgi:hypothetical protein
MDATAGSRGHQVTEAIVNDKLNSSDGAVDHGHWPTRQARRLLTKRTIAKMTADQQGGHRRTDRQERRAQEAGQPTAAITPGEARRRWSRIAPKCSPRRRPGPIGDKLVVDGKSIHEVRKQVVDAKLAAIAKDYTEDQVKIAFDSLTNDIKVDVASDRCY